MLPFCAACAKVRPGTSTAVNTNKRTKLFIGERLSYTTRVLYRFGIFEFDSGSGQLRKNGRASAIEPQPAKALALLLSKAGDVVSREELRDAIWGRTHVDVDRGLAY